MRRGDLESDGVHKTGDGLIGVYGKYMIRNKVKMKSSTQQKYIHSQKIVNNFFGKVIKDQEEKNPT